MTVPRLLLVDDEPLARTTFKHGLGARGFEVTAVDGAGAALEAAASARFDLAVLDIRMPGMDGLELGRRLREQHGLPALYLTAIDDSAQVARAVQAGALTYLVKPMAINQLVPAIEAALARARELNALIGQTAQLERALSGGRHTSMAVGMLMERHRLDERQAFEMLRQQARSQRRPLEECSQDLVEGRANPRPVPRQSK